MDFLNSQATALPAHATQFQLLAKLYSTKLWHQLAEQLDSFLQSKPEGWNAKLSEEMYHSMLKQHYNQIHPLRFIVIISRLAKTIANELGDEASLQFLLTVQEQMGSRLDSDAQHCLSMELSIARTKTNNIIASRELLDIGRTYVQQSTSSETLVYSTYYHALTKYQWALKAEDAFYSAAVMFLAYGSVDDLSEDERFTLARDVALVAVGGRTQFNLGEVLATPVLLSLTGTSAEWLKKLAESMHEGAVERFLEVYNAHKNDIPSDHPVAKSWPLVPDKMVVMGLVNLVVERGTHNRIVSFADIATTCYISEDQVEKYVMRAMSLKLVRGLINEVDRTVTFSWVRPRVLDRKQLSSVVEQLGVMVEKVKDAMHTVEDRSLELFV